jgi:hypothetical protein
MKNKNQNTIVETVETAIAETTAEVKQLGRPVNPNSERQKRLAELEAKRANGELRRGRPVNTESARQKRLAEQSAKTSNGGVIKRGRPVNGESARQKRLAELEAKRANGELKRGRPAMVKPVVVETPVVTEEQN